MRERARRVTASGAARSPREDVRSWLPRAGLGTLALAGVAAAVALGRLPPTVGGAVFGLSALAYLAYGSDKAAAIQGRRRTPERHLHLLALLGGWPGALIAQQRFRHKTAKASFQTLFWLSMVVNLGATAWLLADDMGRDRHGPPASVLGPRPRGRHSGRRGQACAGAAAVLR